ncbi:MAG: FAD-dependent oxidoreductase [Dehalococcoidia bacterium]
MSNSPNHENLFSPYYIGNMRLKNRIVMAPMVTRFATDTGAASPVHRAFFAERAKGGVGLIVVEAAYVDSLGQITGCQLGIDRDSLVPSHVELTEAVHRFGSRIAIQLHHGGDRANPTVTGGSIMAASSLPESDASLHELTTDEISAVVGRFGEAAGRAKRAGYDAVEIHGAHGFLLHQFLSPATNLRTDEYGGSVENRLRFTLEVIQSVRQAVGPGYPILYRLSSEGGYGIEDAVAFSKEWEVAGVDALHVSIGGTASISLVSPETSPMAIPQGYMVEYAHAIKRVVNIPVITVGEIRDPAFAEDILSHGRADFIALARPLLADPYWVAKAAKGLDQDIRKCISCDYCRLGGRFGAPIRCLINPQVGREEWLLEPEPATKPRKVMVVGSGPAGMEVARVAALRGHQVSLYEAEPTLGGGQLALAQAAPFKEKLGGVKDYLTRELEQLPVDVRLKSMVDAATVEREAPEVLVVATGAVPLVPDIPGIGGENVVSAHQILRDEGVPQGKQVVVLGGRQVGCETAEYLALRDNSVTIVARSPADQLADDAPNTYRNWVVYRMLNGLL